MAIAKNPVTVGTNPVTVGYLREEPIAVGTVDEVAWLSHDQKPWPLGWEQDSYVLACRHEQWELCRLDEGPRRPQGEWVVRCVNCCAPRCGDSTDEDPCMRARHHVGVGHRNAIHMPYSLRFPDFTDREAVERWLADG